MTNHPNRSKKFLARTANTEAALAELNAAYKRIGENRKRIVFDAGIFGTGCLALEHLREQHGQVVAMRVEYLTRAKLNKLLKEARSVVACQEDREGMERAEIERTRGRNGFPV